MRWRRPLPQGKWVSRQLPNQPHPLLIEANQRLANGQYHEAALLFEKIAMAAENRNGPRAPIFNIQAGKARIMSGDLSTGMEHIRHGLNMLFNQKRFGQFQSIGQRIIHELSDHSLAGESAELSHWMDSLEKERGFVEDNQPPRQNNPTRVLLPTACPSCGGRVHPNEVAWVDEITAECAYCGRLIRSDAA